MVGFPVNVAAGDRSSTPSTPVRGRHRQALHQDLSGGRFRNLPVQPRGIAHAPLGLIATIALSYALDIAYLVAISRATAGQPADAPPCRTAVAAVPLPERPAPSPQEKPPSPYSVGEDDPLPLVRGSPQPNPHVANSPEPATQRTEHGASRRAPYTWSRPSGTRNLDPDGHGGDCRVFGRGKAIWPSPCPAPAPTSLPLVADGFFGASPRPGPAREEQAHDGPRSTRLILRAPTAFLPDRDPESPRCNWCIAVEAIALRPMSLCHRLLGTAESENGR